MDLRARRRGGRGARAGSRAWSPPSARRAGELRRPVRDRLRHRERPRARATGVSRAQAVYGAGGDGGSPLGSAGGSFRRGGAGLRAAHRNAAVGWPATRRSPTWSICGRTSPTPRDSSRRSATRWRRTRTSGRRRPPGSWRHWRGRSETKPTRAVRRRRRPKPPLSQRALRSNRRTIRRTRSSPGTDAAIASRRWVRRTSRTRRPAAGVARPGAGRRRRFRSPCPMRSAARRARMPAPRPPATTTAGHAAPGHAGRRARGAPGAVRRIVPRRRGARGPWWRCGMKCSGIRWTSRGPLGRPPPGPRTATTTCRPRRLLPRYVRWRPCLPPWRSVWWWRTWSARDSAPRVTRAPG